MQFNPLMQAPNYTPSVDFSDDEANNTGGRSTVRTQALDTELQNISTSINSGNANLSLLQRDDGALRDGIVSPSSLSAATKAFALATKWNARGIWATATAYAANDMVEFSGASYICVTAHTSSVFATDKAAGRWQIFVSASQAAAIGFTPTSTLSATDTQSAIDEADTENRALSTPMTAAFYGGL